MRRIVLVVVLSLLGVSCGSLDGLQDNLRELPETRIRISDDIVITKNGLDVGRANIQPTTFRHRNVMGQRVPQWYGVTVIIKY